MKKFLVTWVLMVVLWVAAVGFVVTQISHWWDRNQVSQRIETFANKTLPVK